MILLDTHAWLWAMAEPQHLGKAATKMIEKQVSVGGLRISDISLWEVAMLSHKGRIQTKGSLLKWIKEAVHRSRVTMQPITPEIAFESTLFSDDLADPADRLIAATAKCLEIELITKDRTLRKLPGIETIW